MEHEGWTSGKQGWGASADVGSGRQAGAQGAESTGMEMAGAQGAGSTGMEMAGAQGAESTGMETVQVHRLQKAQVWRPRLFMLRGTRDRGSSTLKRRRTGACRAHLSVPTCAVGVCQCSFRLRHAGLGTLGQGSGPHDKACMHHVHSRVPT